MKADSPFTCIAECYYNCKIVPLLSDASSCSMPPRRYSAEGENWEVPTNWDDDAVLEDVRQLIDKRASLSELSKCNALLAAVPPELEPPVGQSSKKPKVLLMVLEHAVSDEHDEHLRAACAMLGLKNPSAEELENAKRYSGLRNRTTGTIADKGVRQAFAAMQFDRPTQSSRSVSGDKEDKIAHRLRSAM